MCKSGEVWWSAGLAAPWTQLLGRPFTALDRLNERAGKQPWAQHQGSQAAHLRGPPEEMTLPGVCPPFLGLSGWPVLAEAVLPRAIADLPPLWGTAQG